MSEASTSVPVENRSAAVASNEVIDASLRLPTLFFVAAAIFWLVKASGWGLINALQTTNPEFLSAFEWLTFGRMSAAAQTGFLYGWCLNAAFIVGLWIMARLSRTPIPSSGLLIVGGVFWNLAVFASIVGIFFQGDVGSGIWLRVPNYCIPIFLGSYMIIGAWGVYAFSKSKTYTYASQWYILAALFCLPWLLTVATFMIGLQPTTGVVQAITSTWYAGNLAAVVLAPIAIATAYYMLPKLLNRPVTGYYMSIIGFWSLVAFASWIGPSLLIGSPVPIWIQAMGTVSCMLVTIPVIIISFNLHRTIGGDYGKVFSHPELRFVAFGLLMFTALGFVALLSGLRGFSAVTQFTWFQSGFAYHMVYAFFSMIMFGALYYLVPRVLGEDWPASTMAKAQYMGGAIASVLGVLALYYAGWQQGIMAAAVDAEGAALHSWAAIASASKPLLLGKTLAVLIASIGHVAFAINFALLAVNYLRKHAIVAELLPTATAQEA